MKYQIAFILLMLPSFAFGAPAGKCGVVKSSPPSGCENAGDVTSFRSSCTGSGLMGCVSYKDMGNFGLNTAKDCLEVYCVENRTRVCLSGEKCPWREDDNMKSDEYPKGLQTSAVKVPTKDMTCSPFGLDLKAESRMAYKLYSDVAPFEAVICDAKGTMTIDGGSAPPPPAGIPKFGEVCGSKPRPCKPGIKCGTVTKKTYMSYDELITDNANYVGAGPCK
jgi:hypothetical protein